MAAGNASGINDAAAALLVMSAAKAAKLGLNPLARIKAFASKRGLARYAAARGRELPPSPNGLFNCPNHKIQTG